MRLEKHVRNTHSKASTFPPGNAVKKHPKNLTFWSAIVTCCGAIDIGRAREEACWVLETHGPKFPRPLQVRSTDRAPSTRSARKSCAERCHAGAAGVAATVGSGAPEGLRAASAGRQRGLRTFSRAQHAAPSGSDWVRLGEWPLLLLGGQAAARAQSCKGSWIWS